MKSFAFLALLVFGATLWTMDPTAPLWQVALVIVSGLLAGASCVWIGRRAK